MKKVAHFRGILQVRESRDHNNLFEVCHNFSFYSAQHECLIKVTKGFITDFASVPRLPFVYILLGGQGNKAAVIHDWLYSSHEVPRDVADSIFREALEVAGYSALVCGLMWSGVRTFGQKFWDMKNLPQTQEVNYDMKTAQPYENFAA